MVKWPNNIVQYFGDNKICILDIVDKLLHIVKVHI